MTSPEVDPGNLRRLARAIHLECEREGPDVYRVSGGAEPHTVIVHDQGQGWTCNCIDYGVNGGICKHMIRVRLARGDEQVLRTLQLLVPYPSQRRDRTEPASRRPRSGRRWPRSNEPRDA